ncbi:GtrA family protein [bacterium]|nr:GtrA family protein [bacterium]
MPRYYNNLKKYLADNFSKIYYLADKNKKIIKFLIAGGMATIVDLSILFFLTDVLDFWYLVSAAISYSTAFIVSFSLQKFWTFREDSVDGIKKQFYYYFSMTVCTMFLNLFFLFVLVDFFKVYYILAQLVIGVFLASGRFVINNFLIFKVNKNEIGN